MLSEYEMNRIMNRFPNVELSYEKIIHKKVFAHQYLLIPQGPKFFAWFTYYNNKNVCILLEIGKEKNSIGKIFIATTCFHSDLSFGTILYGTRFKYESNYFFSTEDILYYKSHNLSDKNFRQKQDILKDLFMNNLKQIAYKDSHLIFGLPIMKNTYREIMDETHTIPYRIYCIQYRDFSQQRTLFNQRFNQCNIKANFLIKPDIQNDIYQLYCYQGNGKIFHSIAMISDYKTSVMMNGLFRNIKENVDLDKLEESDDEEEFENISEDKFVDMKKELVMSCVYKPRFKKWQPCEILHSREKLITKKQLDMIEKKSY